MATVPSEISQFLSIAVPVFLNVLLFFFLAGCLVYKAGKYDFIVAPMRPKSRVGQSKGACGWLSAVLKIKEADVYEAGGLDAVLAVRRTLMRLEIVLLWCLIAIPVALIYSLNIRGGSTESGFDRIGYSNANIQTKNNGTKRTGDSMARIWITVFALYLMPLIAYPVIERFDLDAIRDITEEAKKVRLQDYAIVIRGIEEESRSESVLRAFFDAALGVGSVLKVVLLKDTSALSDTVKAQDKAVEDKEPKKDTKDKLMGAVLGSAGGARERFNDFKAAMKSAKRADLANAEYQALSDDQKKSKDKKKVPGLKGKTTEAAKSDAYENLEKKRQALIRAADTEDQVSTSVAIIVFDSISKATSAATAPLGLVRQWRVDPAPEPCDLDFATLEKNEIDHEKIAAKEATGERIKIAIFIFWSLILTGLAIVAGAILSLAEKQLSGVLKQIIIILSGMMPALIASIMMSLVVAIQRAINKKCRGSVDCWCESNLQYVTMQDYVLFLTVIGFFVSLLGSSLFDAIVEAGPDPFKIFKLIAVGVPGKAYYFSMILLVKTAVFINKNTRFVQYIVYLIMSTLFTKTDFEKSLLKKPKNCNFPKDIGWEHYAFLIAAVYTSLAPYAPYFSALYIGLFYYCNRLQLSAIERTPFATRGQFWRLAVTQTYDAMALGYYLTLGVLLFSNAIPHFAASLPLIIIHAVIRGKSNYRYEHLNVHGKARGCLPLLEAAVVDSALPAEVVPTLIVPTIEQDKLYEPPTALPPQQDDSRREFLPGPDRTDDPTDLEKVQFLIDAWESRYNDPSKLPQLIDDKTSPAEVKSGVP